MTNDTLAKLAADNVPERIYLVLGEDIAPDDDPRADFNELGEVTWCADKQFEHDIEYVRADLAALTAQAPDHFVDADKMVQHTRAAQALPAAEPVLREKFEAHMSDNGKWPNATMRAPTGGYLLLRTAVAWENWKACAAALAAQQAAQAPEGWVGVPLKFVQGFNTLAHNYSLKAVAPDYYWGNEADAFSEAYRRCGKDLAKLRAMLAARPQAEGA